MNSSLNHVYRIVWNATLGLWQVASEVTRGRGKTGSSQQARKARRAGLAAPGLTLMASALTLAAPAAWAVLPTGGVVVAGQASIQQAGNALNIVQGTDKAAIDWQSFSIGQGNTVNFQQLSSSSVALNRVLGNDVSVIQGAINANGQVFLVNQNGVLFTPTAQVNVGGIVASTQNISTDDFMAGRYKFSGNSTATVENQGSIKAADGGVVALIAAKVINTGNIEALKGTVGLAAGNTVLLDLGGPVKIQVTEGALNAAIEQSGGIRADGGTVYLTAKAAGNLAASVINHTGVTKALSMASLTGEAGEVAQATGSIALSADLVNQAGMLDVSGLRGGQINVLAGQYTDSGTTLADGSQQGGSIDVRAKNITQTSSAVVSASSSEGEGGRVELIGDLGHGIGQFGGKIYATGRRRGGFVDTSGAKLILNDSLRVDTSSSEGETGTWLLDPIDFTIAASGGDLTGAALSTALQNNSVTIQTLTSSVSCSGVTCGTGNTSGNGDIHVNDSVTWASDQTLTLSASRHININENITATNAAGKLSLQVGQGSTAASYTGTSGNTPGDYTIVRGRSINLQAGDNFSLKRGNDGTIKTFTVLRYDPAVGQTNNLISANDFAGNFALGSDVLLNSGVYIFGQANGLSATNYNGYNGEFHGLGHSVKGFNVTQAVSVVSGFAGLLSAAPFLSYQVYGTVIRDVTIDKPVINISAPPPGSTMFVSGLLGQSRLAGVGGVATPAGARTVVSGVYVVDADFSLTKLPNGTPIVAGIVAGNAFFNSVAGSLVVQDSLVTGKFVIESNANVSSFSPTFGGIVASHAFMQRVGFDGTVTITSASLGTGVLRVGGLAGSQGNAARNVIAINNSYTRGIFTISGNYSAISSVGGLHGSLGGAALTGADQGPIVVGINNSVVDNTWNITGLIVNNGGKLNTGLFGNNSNSNLPSTFNNLYYNSDKVPTDWSTASVGGSSPAPTGVSTALFNAQSNFAALDFNNIWAMGTNGPVLRVHQIKPFAPTSQQVFIRLACGTLCFNTYGDTLPSFVFDDFAAANGTTALTNATLTGTATFNVTDANNNTVSNFSSLSNADTYKFVYTGGLMASGFELVAGDAVTWTVVPRTLTVELSGTTANPLTKTYDGNANLALAAQNFLLSNFAPGTSQGGTISQTNGVFNSPNVATANLVTASLTAANLSVTGSTLASNYVLPTSVSKAGTITAKALTITDSTVANKTYNGERAATVTAGTLNGLAAVNGVSEVLGTTTATGQFASQNVARDANGAVTTQNVAVMYTLVNGGSALASNYSLADQTLQGTITPKALAVTGLTAQSKEYDRLLTATVTGTAKVDTTGVVGQDQVSVEGTVNGGLFVSKDVGTQKPVAISGLMLTGTQAGNYMLSATALTANITAKALAVTGLTAGSKEYDGNRTAMVSSTNAVFDGIIQGDMLSVTANGLFDTQDAGTNIAVAFSGIALSGTDAKNYALSTTSATTQANITPKALTVMGTTVADKTYNGTLGATVTVGELSGFVAGETLGTTTATGTFADKDVARDANGNVIAKNVTVAYTLMDGADTQTLGGGAPIRDSSGNVIGSGPLVTPGAKASNYTLANETKTAIITPKALTINGSKVTEKQYDGTQAATVTAGMLAGLVTVNGVTESLGTTTAAGTFASLNASPEAQNVTTVYTLVNGSNAAHKAGNYSLANEVLTGKINQRVLSIMGSTVTTRDYDGGKAATVVAGTLGNLVAGETLGATTASGEFLDQNAGSNKDVAVTYTLANRLGTLSNQITTLASNYTLANETLKGNVAQKAVTVDSITADDKTYDGNTTATLSNQGAVATGVSGESLAVTTTGSFNDRNAGARKVNTTTTIASTGDTLASNYSLSNATNSVDATIAQKSLIIAATATNKVYDGKSTATATLSTGDLVTNDKVSLNQTAANFINAQGQNDKNVGLDKTVRVTGLSLSGDDAANYKLTNANLSADTTADISAKSLSISATASNKVYNANTLADVTLSTGDKVDGDTLTLNQTAATFDTKHVGTGKTVTVAGLALSGTDALNYSLKNADAKTTATADITQAALTISGITAANKTYDGNNSATVSTTQALYKGLVEGDKLVVSAKGLFSDKNADTNKTVSLTSTYAGADVGNYNITGQATTQADIGKLSGVVVIADKQSKVVGTVDPTLTFSVTGLLAGDALNGGLMRDAGEAAGLYAITQGDLGNTNYVINTFTPAELTISQPIADVAIANANRIEQPALQPSVGERDDIEESDGDTQPFMITANQTRASGPAQLVVVNGGIRLPNMADEEQQ